jgi:hypothetical protein
MLVSNKTDSKQKSYTVSIKIMPQFEIDVRDFIQTGVTLARAPLA